MPYKKKEDAIEAAKRFRKTPKGKACIKRGYKKWSNTTKGSDKKRELQRKWNKTDKGKACKKRWYSSEKGKIWNENKRLKSKYGIDLIQKQFMYDNQNGLCKLCDDPLPEMRKSCVEHCHRTGTIRGLVHNECNIFIGIVENNPNTIRNVSTYLKIKKDNE